MKITRTSPATTASPSPLLWLLISMPLLALGMMMAVSMLLAELVFEPGLDLGVYRKAADFIAAGANPYDAATFNTSDLRWQYPPFALLLVAPLHFVPLESLFAFWATFAIALPLLAMIAVAARRILGPTSMTLATVARRTLLVAALTVVAVSASAVLNTFHLGQIGVLLAALVFWDLVAPDSWRGFGRWRIPRGVGVGLATAVKLTPAIFIVHLLITRQWRTAINAILTTLASWTLAFVIFPSFSVYFWFQGGLFRAASDNSPERIVHEDNIAIGAAFDRIRIDMGADIATMSATPRLAIMVVAGVVGLLAAAYLHRSGRGMLAVLVVGLTATLVSPVSWLHHGTFLALLAPVVLLVALHAHRNRKYAAGPLYVLGVALFAIVALPSQVIDSRFLQPAPIDGLYFTVALILSILTLTALARQSDTAATHLD